MAKSTTRSESNGKHERFAKASRHLFGKLANEFAALVRKALPSELNVTDQEILNHFRTYKPEKAEVQPPLRTEPITEIPIVGAEKWEKLVSSDEPKYL